MVLIFPKYWWPIYHMKLQSTQPNTVNKTILKELTSVCYPKVSFTRRLFKTSELHFWLCQRCKRITKEMHEDILEFVKENSKSFVSEDGISLTILIQSVDVATSQLPKLSRSIARLTTAILKYTTLTLNKYQ